MTTQISADYLIMGSGAMGMAALATTVAAQVQGTGVLVTSPALDAIANVA